MTIFRKQLPPLNKIQEAVKRGAGRRQQHHVPVLGEIAGCQNGFLEIVDHADRQQRRLIKFVSTTASRILSEVSPVRNRL